MTSTLPNTQKTTDERWRFWRDVLVFELKMFIGNLRDFALMPVSVMAAMIDQVSKGEREGSLFYRVLRWGAHSEEVLDAYSPMRDELQDRKVDPNNKKGADTPRDYENRRAAATRSSRAAQTTPVRLGPRDLTLVERANEFCEVLRCAQDDSKRKSGTVVISN